MEDSHDLEENATARAYIYYALAEIASAENRVHEMAAHYDEIDRVESDVGIVIRPPLPEEGTTALLWGVEELEARVGDDDDD